MTTHASSYGDGPLKNFDFIGGWVFGGDLGAMTAIKRMEQTEVNTRSGGR